MRRRTRKKILAFASSLAIIGTATAVPYTLKNQPDETNTSVANIAETNEPADTGDANKAEETNSETPEIAIDEEISQFADGVSDVLDVCLDPSAIEALIGNEDNSNITINAGSGDYEQDMKNFVANLPIAIKKSITDNESAKAYFKKVDEKLAEKQNEQEQSNTEN